MVVVEEACGREESGAIPYLDFEESLLVRNRVVVEEAGRRDCDGITEDVSVRLGHSEGEREALVRVEPTALNLGDLGGQVLLLVGRNRRTTLGITFSLNRGT
jgi:hypothetical protein